MQATTISPWVVTLDALRPFRCAAFGYAAAKSTSTHNLIPCDWILNQCDWVLSQGVPHAELSSSGWVLAHITEQCG